MIMKRNEENARKQRMLLVYNPKAGKSKIRNLLLDIIDIFVKADYEVVAYPTQGPKDAVNIVKTREKGVYDLVVCAGGDGTLDEVVSGMLNSGEIIPIGYIPAGSTNDFAHSLNIPGDMTEAAKHIVEGKVMHCDVGELNEADFVYIAAFGLFTEVSYQTDQRLKNVLGHMAYILEGMKSLYNIKSYKMRVSSDEMEFEGDFLFGMITNSKSVAGFKGLVKGDVQFDDGVYEVTFIKRPKNPLEIQEILGALLLEEINSNYMYSFRTKKLTIESEEMVPWTLDGEFGGEHDHVVIENNHKAVEIVVKDNEISIGE